MKAQAPLIPSVKVSQLLNRNQFIIVANDWAIFQSYESIVAYYNYVTRELLVVEYYINYSKTTSKHLYIFINDYTCYSISNLKELKKAIKKGTIKTI